MVDEEIDIQILKSNEAQEVEGFVKQVFNQYIAPDYAEEGVKDFYEYCSSDKLLERTLMGGYQIYLAKYGQKLVGVLEKREETHISMLFVARQFQRQGIAKALIASAFSNYLGDITVNASPYAAVIYEKLGFAKITKELFKDGITYIPMIREQKRN